MTILEERQAITGGVDTHSEVHVAAALDAVGGLLGTREFPATAVGCASLLGWLGKFGDVALVGVEGTGSYGAGLARYLAGRGVRVVEVDRSDRQDRRRNGKSDPLDAVSAARAALSGRASGAPKGRDGAVEAIRFRIDRHLEEALAYGPDPLHLAAVFGFSAKTAVRYANAARQLLQAQAEAASAPGPGDS